MSAKFSPFDDKRIAISCCDNFGLVGKGKLLILDITPGLMKVSNSKNLKPVRIIEDHDAIFDCAWTEGDPNLIISGCGDGEVKLWRIDTGQCVFTRHEHKEAVNSIECSHQSSNLFLTAGMDGTSRLWDIAA
jgi:peroxin-7